MTTEKEKKIIERWTRRWSFNIAEDNDAADLFSKYRTLLNNPETPSLFRPFLEKNIERLSPLVEGPIRPLPLTIFVEAHP